MSHHETREQILDWTGGNVDLDEQQMDRFVDAWERVMSLYQDEDEGIERDAALSAALQVILGETTLEEAGHAANQAATKLVQTRAARAGAIIASAGSDSEVRLAERAQTTRVTVRRALGKDRDRQ